MKNQPTRNLPGFVSRGLAFAVDIFAMAAICLIVTQGIRLTGEFFRMGAFPLVRLVVDFAMRASVVIVIATYLPSCWALTGRSIGKALFGMRIVRADGSELNFMHCAVRFAGYWLSALPFGLGFLTVVFDKRRRAFHDRLAGTLVVFDEPSLEVGHRRPFPRSGPPSPLRP
jgi:uncharacterized RDD family membrane protein YckC